MPKDWIIFSRTLTPRKVWNGLHTLLSYFLSRQTGRSTHPAQPISLSIEPTTACNLRCPECPSGLRSFSRPTGKMDLALLSTVLDQVAPHTLYLNYYFQGEPYLHPQFLDMVRLSVDRNIFTSTSTNAHFLDDEKAEATVRSGLHRIIISVDGADQETYEQYRKTGDLRTVIEGTERLIKWKKHLRSQTPHVVLQFLVVRPNEHQVSEIKELGTRLGVDEVRFKTAQIYDFENGSPLIPTRDEYSRYRQRSDGKWEIKNPLDNHCWRMWSGCVITWDGKVVPCCFDKDAEHAMGNLRVQPLREVWNNAHYRLFRQRILRSRSEIEMCRNCSEGTQVWT